MFPNLFDRYNIRARLSVYVIVISPLIITLYIMYDQVRSVGTSIVLITIAAAFSNYFLIAQRYYKKAGAIDNTAASFLYHDDPHLNRQTKDRYYQRMSSIDSSFSSLQLHSDSDQFKTACNEVIIWLRNNTRDNNYIQEENMLYGFISNSISVKKMGITCLVISVIMQVVFSIETVKSLADILSDKSLLLLMVIDIAFFCYWIWGVTEKKKHYIAEQYSYALLGAIDSLVITGNHR